MRTETLCGLLILLVAPGFVWAAPAPENEILVVGGRGRTCNEDPECINRLHPAIPLVATATPGQTIVFRTRNASDFDLDPDSTFDDPRRSGPGGSTVHPLTGPVRIEGARAGDWLAVTLLDVAPGRFGYTSLSGIGFLADVFAGPLRVSWTLDRNFAVSADLPGVRIPNAAFPGVVTTLPGPDQHRVMLEREAQLLEAGGSVRPPMADNASPAAVCGPGASAAAECLRTIPPREHGGNMDIRYMQAGVTIYLPCAIDGCGLAIGDVHYAQGDGEVSGTAIEMDAQVTLTTQIVRGERKLTRGPHFEGPVRVLDIPSRRFYATTGYPFKESGEMPPDIVYLHSPTAGRLSNLSKDVSLAARNALLEMVDHISERYGLTREQAYLVCSVAVDVRIGQLVDAPNVGAVALLPTDIFTREPR